MKMFLFPHSLRLVGWIMFIACLAVEAMVWCDFVDFGKFETAANDVIIIGTVLGALFVVCSRERIEDEYTREVRLTSILYAIYGYIAVFILCTLLINGVDFLLFALFNLILFPIIFVVVFQITLERHKMLDLDEEQD